MYMKSLHKTMKPTGSQANEAYMPSRAKKWVRLWDLKRKAVYRKMKKSKCFVNSFLGQIETMDIRILTNRLC